MTDRIEMMNASVKALMTMLEGEMEWEGRTARILYNAFTGFDERLVRLCCETMIDHGHDGVLAFFDPARAEQGPVRIALSVPEGKKIILRMGRLWMASRGERAVLLTRDGDKGCDYYAVENGRIVQRAGWPAKDIARGARRAAAHLAELTNEYARVNALAL